MLSLRFYANAKARATRSLRPRGGRSGRTGLRHVQSVNFRARARRTRRRFVLTRAPGELKVRVYTRAARLPCAQGLTHTFGVSRISFGEVSELSFDDLLRHAVHGVCDGLVQPSALLGSHETI